MEGSSQYHTVAVKHRNEPILFCGLYSDREVAVRNAAQLRVSWAASRLTPPTIRVRTITRDEWEKNRR